MTDYYVNPHVTQYDGSAKATENCTPTSGANGANASTGGAVAKTGAQVRALVKPTEETNPATPGWSLQDLDLAMSRLGVGFSIRSGQGWTAVQQARKAGLYVVLQGDSDRFPDTTCSGAFNGDHAIGVHPDDDASGRWRIDDPICKAARYESEAVLKAYAVKFSPTVRFGVFTTPVPMEEEAMLLTAPKALTGKVKLLKPWGLWRVATDKKTATLPAGTTWDCLGSCTYHQASNGGNGWVGYLVNYKGELHVVPGGSASQFIAAATDCTAAVAAAVKPLNDRIAGMKQKSAAFNADIQND